MTAATEIQKYLDEQSQRGGNVLVQVGSGTNRLRGWLNTNAGVNRGVVWVNIAKPLPFPDQSVDAFLAEHVIEHLPKPVTLRFLNECRRCLKPGGAIRISTPDLGEICSALVLTEKGALLTALTERHARLFRSNRPVTPCDFINDIMRLWGHEYLYTENELRSCLHGAGFPEITRHAAGESDDPRLRGLESHIDLSGLAPINLVLEARPQAQPRQEDSDALLHAELG